MRDLQQIRVSLADRVSPVEQAAAEGLDQPSIAEGI
jgi:hypothetical protein